MARRFPLAALRDAVARGRIHWHHHALERLLERGLSRAAVIEAILKGEVIEEYPRDRPHPRALFHYGGSVALHVVAAVEMKSGICHMITAYQPDLDHFEPDFKTRRNPR